MTPQGARRVRRLLAAIIIASCLIMAGATYLYRWKGLSELKPKLEGQTSYYELY